jgi:hypothetical protein
LMLLDITLHPDLSGTTSETILDKVMQWEYAVNRYDALASAPLSDDIKIATLMKSLGDTYKYALMQLLGNSGTNVTYVAVKEYLVRCMRNYTRARRWMLVLLAWMSPT